MTDLWLCRCNLRAFGGLPRETLSRVLICSSNDAQSSKAHCRLTQFRSVTRRSWFHLRILRRKDEECFSPLFVPGWEGKINLSPEVQLRKLQWTARATPRKLGVRRRQPFFSMHPALRELVNFPPLFAVRRRQPTLCRGKTFH